MIKVAIVEENETVRESLETITNLAAVCQCVGAWGTAKEALPMLWNGDSGRPSRREARTVNRKRREAKLPIWGARQERGRCYTCG